jgi:hypothetical protein
MSIYNKENVKKYDGLYESGHDHEYPNLDLVRLAAKYFTDKNTKVLDFGFGSGENLFHLYKRDFHVDELGEVKFNYFNFSEHEYIACVRKKN